MIYKLNYTVTLLETEKYYQKEPNKTYQYNKSVKQILGSLS